MKRFFAIFLILIIAGCTGSSFGGGNGISLSMSANPTSIRDTQKSLLTISVKNTGDFDTTPTLSLYGLGEEWSYDVLPSFGFIRASNKEIGYVAEEKKESIFLKYLGTLPKGKSFTFEPSARLCYEYNTDASAKVDVYTEEEFYRKSPQQKGISIKQTKAPIQISIDSKQPLISGETLLLDITLSNVGGGTVTTNGCDDIDYGDVDFKTLNTINNLDITLNDGTSCVSIDKNKIYLKKGDTAQLTISCDTAFETDNPKETKDLHLNLKYNYYIDAKTSITVTGTESKPYDATTMVHTTTKTEGLMSTDFCSKLCNYAGTSYKTLTKGEPKYLGYCNTIDADSNSVDYLVDFKDARVLGNPLKVKLKESTWNSNTINSVIDADEKITIGDLKLHNAQVGDFGILDMTIGQLDDIALSTQYIGINVGSATEGSIGLVDSLCAGVISSGDSSSSPTRTQEGKTLYELCESDGKLLKITVLGDLLLLNGFDLTDMAVDGDLETLNKQNIDEFEIVSIANRVIEDMTEVGLNEIHVDKFKLSKLKEVIDPNVLRFAKCDYGPIDGIYVREELDGAKTETHCMCVVQPEKITPEITVELTSKSPTDTCSTTCNTLDSKYEATCLEFSESDINYCSGSSLYSYSLKDSVTDCGDDYNCYCSTKESLKEIEKNLICP